LLESKFSRGEPGKVTGTPPLLCGGGGWRVSGRFKVLPPSNTTQHSPNTTPRAPKRALKRAIISNPLQIPAVDLKYFKWAI